MAGVTYGPFMKTASGEQPKRVFGDITNAENSTTGPPKQKKKESPPDEFVGGWSAVDLSSSEPHSDATEESEVARRTYGMRAVLQRRHAPQITEDVTFYEHKAPNAVEAAKARQSGVALLAFVPTSEQPFEEMPLDGGVSHTSHVPEISSDVVGVSEIGQQQSKVAIEAHARQRQAKIKGRKGGPKTTKGTTYAASFSVWFDGKLVGKYEGRWASALPDIKQKRPGKKLTQDMLSCLLGIKKRELFRKQPGLKKKIDASKFTAKYDV